MAERGRQDDRRRRDGSTGAGGRGRGPRQRSAQAPSQRARHGDPARDAAYEVMRAVADGGYANLVLPTVLREARLQGRDAGFATELTYGTLRMQGLYDAVIDACVDRPGRAIDPAVRDILRLGAHQLLAMRVPDHAAVSATVALARQHVGQGAGGFVNAVLRRVSERSRPEWLEQVAGSTTDPIERLAIENSHPVWVVRALRAALIGHGASTAETSERQLATLLEAHNTPASPTLVARPGLGAEDELKEAGAVPDATAPTAWTMPGGDPGQLAAVRDGGAAVQDAGSQLLALALAAAEISTTDTSATESSTTDTSTTDAPATNTATTNTPTEQWLDLCAGPGGKAGLLAALAVQHGAHLRANEVQAHRADLVRNTLRAVRHAHPEVVHVTVEDGRDVGESDPGRYDRVLVDAPCTGLGALRRRPDARWRRTPKDLAELGPLQRDLLAGAIEATRPGGVVLYSTCSPHLAETEFVVKDVLKVFPSVSAVDVRPLLRDRAGQILPDTGPGPWAQLWPHLHGTDGMFLALLRVGA
ncbi:rRNA small subunit methyltransferase B [Ornithinimicrobium faecis]|uniref:rRNA small subunit methyltransferase B n=2 Tax=Ornithinimicrobium faecis TaxID=2934158 RepID=A0ABY4YNE9_9MICO|nr:transcription antitermination factor NusB [Ornithinimicrobium sp. HY1793]USQ78326.1 rRNA small subunit methyltransferase B [Ornithinimicrobium sp. HY1793]